MDTLKRLGRKKILFIVAGILMVIHLVSLFVVIGINKSFQFFYLQMYGTAIKYK